MSSPLYKSALLYRLAIRALYGRFFEDRYRRIADLIEPGGRGTTTVVDLCCGDMYLYRRYLSGKNVSYTGVDVSEAFFSYGKRHRIECVLQDIGSDRFVCPEADYVVMQGSLYHFLPDPSRLVQSMISSARVAVIITEPVRNLASSRSRVIRTLAGLLSSPNTGAYRNLRFDEASFRAFCHRFLELSELRPISNGRELLAVFRKSGAGVAGAGVGCLTSPKPTER